MATQYTTHTNIPDMETFIKTVEALKALYPHLTRELCITHGQTIFTDIVKTPDTNGRTLTDIYGKRVATDLVSALVRSVAYGYYLRRPELIVEV